MKRFFQYLVAGILLVPVVGTAAVPPVGWNPNPIRSAAGVAMYQNGADIVQVVGLDQGARIVLYQVQDQFNSDYFQRFTLLSAWTTFVQQQTREFSFCNGQFFSTGESPTTRLSFSLRANDEFLTGGFDMGSYPGQKMAWRIWGNECSLQEGTDDPLQLLNSSAPDAMIGLEGLANKSPNTPMGRTFVGVDNPGPNGRSRTALIFTSSSSTQQHAIDVLNAFGADAVMMLDGSGSTQLRVSGSTLIPGDGRTLPQFIGVLSAAPADNTDPTTPTNLTVSPSGCSQSNSFTFSWTASTDAGGSGVAGYKWQINNTGTITNTTATSVTTTAPNVGSHTFTVWAYDNASNESAKASIGFCYQPSTGSCSTNRIIPNTCVPSSQCYPAAVANLKTLPDATSDLWQSVGQSVRGMLNPGEGYSFGFEYRASTTTGVEIGLSTLSAESSSLGLVVSQSTLPMSTSDWKTFWSAPFSVTAQQVQNLPNLRFIRTNTNDGLEIRNARILSVQ